MVHTHNFPIFVKVKIHIKKKNKVKIQWIKFCSGIKGAEVCQTTTLLTENGQRMVSCGCSKCPAPLPHAWMLSTFRKNWTAGCSSARPERQASALCVENSTLSALVRLSISPTVNPQCFGETFHFTYCELSVLWWDFPFYLLWILSALVRLSISPNVLANKGL